MNHADRLVDIALRKERLIIRIAYQRSAIAAAWQAWEKPAAVADRGIAFVGFLKSHPVFITLAVALVTVLRLRKLKGWWARGLVLWRVWRSAGAWLRRPSA